MVRRCGAQGVRGFAEASGTNQASGGSQPNASRSSTEREDRRFPRPCRAASRLESGFRPFLHLFAREFCIRQPFANHLAAQFAKTLGIRDYRAVCVLAIVVPP
jgi:hypothetical protein